MQEVILTVYWILYFTLHSILASSWLKKLIKNKFLKLYPLYRLAYNLIALITLFLVLEYQQSITPVLFFQKTLILQIIGYSITFIGSILGYLAFKNYSTSEFLGLDYNKNLQKKPNTLNTSGFNHLVRHPLYFASLLLIWGYFLAKPNSAILIMNGVITVYFIIGTKLEEHKLIKEFGQQYKDYILQVPMLLPNLTSLLQKIKK